MSSVRPRPGCFVARFPLARPTIAERPKARLSGLATLGKELGWPNLGASRPVSVVGAREPRTGHRQRNGAWRAAGTSTMQLNISYVTSRRGTVRLAVATLGIAVLTMAIGRTPSAALQAAQAEGAAGSRPGVTYTEEQA